MSTLGIRLMLVVLLVAAVVMVVGEAQDVAARVTDWNVTTIEVAAAGGQILPIP